MQRIITFLGGRNQLEQQLWPQAAVAARWRAHAAFVEGTWEHVPQPWVVAVGVFRGTSWLPPLCSSLEECVLGVGGDGDSCPYRKPLFGRALLLNKQPWTMFGAEMKGTCFCFNSMASFFCGEKHPRNLQAGEKHLSSCFQPPHRMWTEQGQTVPRLRWFHPSPQHQGTAATEMLKTVPYGPEQTWLFLQNWCN